MSLAAVLPAERDRRSFARPSGATVRALAFLAALTAGGALAVGLNAPPAVAPTAPAPAAVPKPAAGAAWASVPEAAQLAVARALGADDAAYRVTATRTGLTARNPVAGALAFGRQGVQVRVPGGSATFRLAGPAVTPTPQANRVTYRRGAVTEWYANGPLGLEQGFDVARNPGGGRLRLDLELGGTLRPRTSATSLELTGPDGATVLRASGLAAVDARGRSLPARFVRRGAGVRIAVDVRHARFPVTVDPLVQQGTLTASDGVAGEHLGSVAIDGSTIVVGAPSATVAGNRQGAVYVFTKPAGGWTDAVQAAKLIASDATNLATAGGYYGDSLGVSVGISGDTVVAGAPIGAAGQNPGRLYVWTKPATGWGNAVQNAELNPSDPSQNGQLGSTVAIDGDTIIGGVVGGYQKPGKVYVWTRPAGGWTSVTQTARLTVSGLNGNDGLAGAIDVSGSTVVAGAPFLDNGTTVAGGAAFVWTKDAGAGWSDAQPAAKLVAAQPVTQETLGGGVAVDGASIVAGAPHYQSQGGSRPSGSAYVFVRPAAGWSGQATQTARLTASDPHDNDEFGGAVGISGDRVAAGVPIVGGTGGATYVFDEPAGGWADATQSDKVAAATGGPEQGSNVAVSGSTVVASAPYATTGGHAGQGGAVVFEPGTPATTTTGTTTTATTTTPTPATTTTAPDVSTFTVPAGQITNPDAPKPPPDLTTAADIIAGLFGIKAGSGQTVNLGEFTFVAYCAKPVGQCAAGTSFGQQLGHTAAGSRAVSFRAAGTKAKKKAAPVLAKSGFVVPAGARKRVAVKLTAAGKKLLASKHRIAGYLTITVKLDGGKTASATRKLTLKQGRKKR